MKSTKQLWLALMLLPMLCACQSDDIENDIKEEIPEETPAVEPLTIKATLPSGDDKSRAQVQYGNQDVAAGEFFMWNLEDEIVVFSKVAKDPKKKSRTYQIKNETDINGNSATFTMIDGETNNVNFFGGSQIGVNHYYIATYGMKFGSSTMDGPNTINADARVQQVRTDNPGNKDLEHLKDMLKMIAVTTVGGPDEQPTFSFKHLSSLMRITLRNSSSTESITINKVNFNYGSNSTFYTGEITTDLNIDDLDLKNNGLTFSGKTSTSWDSGDMNITLSPNESYDLFFAVLSSAKAPANNDKLTISMGITRNSSSETIETVIEGFKNIVIQPGLRYWFDLTVTADGNLMQTSKLPDYS